MARKPHIEVYPQAQRRPRGGDPKPPPLWRYRYWSANGRNVENPGQGYTRKGSAVRAAERQHPGIEVRDEHGKVLRPAVAAA